MKEAEDTGASTIVQLPLAFVRSGVVNMINGRANYIGMFGGYWSRTVVSSTIAYYFSFSSTRLEPSYGSDGYRWAGYPFR